MPTGRRVSSERRLGDDASGIWWSRWIIGRGALGGPESGSSHSVRSRGATSSGERLDNNSLPIAPPPAEQAKAAFSFLEDAPKLDLKGDRARSKSMRPLYLPSSGQAPNDPPPCQKRDNSWLSPQGRQVQFLQQRDELRRAQANRSVAESFDRCTGSPGFRQA